MRFLNGFILIGLLLFIISMMGLMSGNRLLTEPGQVVSPYSWLLYLAASAIMLVNGAVSVWNAQQNEKQNPKPVENAPAQDSTEEANVQQ